MREFFLFILLNFLGLIGFAIDLVKGLIALGRKKV